MSILSTVYKVYNYTLLTSIRCIKSKVYILGINWMCVWLLLYTLDRLSQKCRLSQISRNRHYYIFIQNIHCKLTPVYFVYSTIPRLSALLPPSKGFVKMVTSTISRSFVKDQTPANWPAVGTILTVWFDQLEARFLKRSSVQIVFPICVKNSWPPAENVNEPLQFSFQLG